MISFKTFICEDEASKFRTGHCDAFALALHELTNKPLGIISGIYYDEEYEEDTTEDVHAVIYLNDNEYIDVDGIGNLQSGNFYFNNKIDKIVLNKVQPNDVEYMFSVEGISEEELKMAKDFILKHKEKYGI